jgi:recombination protein RecA
MSKICGKGNTYIGNELEAYKDVIPFSSINLNNATGIGGLPIGKIVEILGWESAGKTTISTDIIGNAQKKFGKPSLLIDRENSYDPFYAQSLGVDIKQVVIARPASLEDNYDVIESALESNLFSVIICDSLTSFEPQASIDGNNAMGKESRINSSRLRGVMRLVEKTDTCVIFINQIREKIGVMFGSPETTNGGNALKFYSHMRIMIRRTEIKAGYNTMQFKFIKNKSAPPMKESKIKIIWGKGFDLDGEAIEIAIQEGIIKREGNSYFYGEEKIAKSKDTLTEFISNNPEFVLEIREKVKNFTDIIKLEEGDESLSSFKEKDLVETV